MIYNYLKRLFSLFFIKLKKKQIKFVYDSDLENLLKKLDILDAIMSEKVKCYICGGVITLENIGAIIKVKGRVELICQNPVCISNYQK